MIAHSSATIAPSLGPCFGLIETVANAGKGLVDLWEESPIRLDSNDSRTDELIDILFPGNPFLCCGWSRHRLDTRPRNRWYRLHDLQSNDGTTRSHTTAAVVRARLKQYGKAPIS